MRRLRQKYVIALSVFSVLIIFVAFILIVVVNHQIGLVKSITITTTPHQDNVELINEGSDPTDPITEDMPKEITEEITGVDSQYVDIREYGAIPDANFYNIDNNTYYSDEEFTIEATDNTEAFSRAFNSGNNILIPKGKWFVDHEVIMNHSLSIEAEDAVIYTRSSEKYKYLFYIKGNNTSISGMTVRTTLDQTPLILNVPKDGLGSNVFAFVVEADDVTIENVKTYNVCRGVNKGTQVHNKNLTIIRCEFYDATIPVFAFYIDGMKISSSYLEVNDSGLDPGFHSLYFAAYTKNVTVENCKLVFKTENNGSAIQLYSSDAVNEPIIENIAFKNIEVESKASHLFVLGKVDGLYADSITFTKNESYTDKEVNYGKIMFLHDYVYNITIINSKMNFFDTANIINANGEHYGNILLKHNEITTTFNENTNLFEGVCDFTIDDNTFTISKRLGGNVFGFKKGGTITFKNNSVISVNGDLVLGSGTGSGKLLLYNNEFVSENRNERVCFYNNDATQLITAIGNTFIGFTQLVENTFQESVIDKNNIYK